MIFKIIAVGRIKEKYWREAIDDYRIRLQPYVRLEFAEIPIARLPEKSNPGQENKAIETECKAILEKLKAVSGPVVVLDKKGTDLDSLKLAQWLEKIIIEGKNDVAWVIGGSYGLNEAVLERADMVLSFSKMTFPHQMMRPILLEQIYRSYRIMHHEPYHK